MTLLCDGRAPTLDEWRALYTAALKFRDLEPWKWMDDAQLFAVRDPESQEVGYCCVLGALDEVYALSVYPGEQGLTTYLRMETYGPGPGFRDLRLYMRCINAEFEDRSALEPADSKVLKSLGLKARGRKSVPLFRTHEPFKFPWFLSAAESRFMIVMLEQAIDVCTRAREDESLIIVAEDAPLLVRVRRGPTPDAPWEDQLEPFPLPPEVEVSVATPNPFDIARMKSQLPKGKGTWEVDYGCAPFPLQEVRGDRPIFPLMPMILDHDSGAVFSMDIEKSADGEESLFRHLLDLIQNVGVIPRRLLVANPLVLTSLEQVVRGLGIKMELKDRLPALEAAYEELQDSMAGEMERLT